jgi:HEAT repeat protein
MPRSVSAPKPSKVGVAITFEALMKTHNEAAFEVLVAALDSPQPAIADGAVETLLRRRSLTGHREVFARLATLAPRQRAIVANNPRWLGRAVREAIVSTSDDAFARGCSAAADLRDYEMIPTLVQVAEDQNNRHREAAAAHVLMMAEHLYDDLAAQRNSADGRDPQLTRKHVLHSLEQSVNRFAQYRRPEILEAFLLLAPRDHPALKRILADPMHAAYVPLIELLTRSPRSGIVRLLLSFLDDPNCPSAALNVFARRSDLKFVEHFLRKIVANPSSALTQNLRRIDPVAWIQSDPALVDPMDDSAQQGSILLAQTCGIRRDDLFKFIEHVMRHGKAAGRRAAATALASIQGADANQLVQQSLSDTDPQVQAALMVQLRQRGIPGAFSHLVTGLDSSYDVVRAAARRCLDEFSFDRFLSAFDMLDEDVRSTTGPMVRKVDPTAPERLLEELKARSRTRRMRGIAIAAVTHLVQELESAIIERLADEDHLVRAEAAKALAQTTSDASKSALSAALNDPSILVQEAAQRSLHHRAATRIAPPPLGGFPNPSLNIPGVQA